MRKFFLKQFKLLLIIATSIVLTNVSAFATDTIKVGAIFDLSGGLNIYGIQQSRALHLAVNKINNNGGINGKKIKVIEYDSQSSLSNYTQFTNTLIRKDRIVALFAGLASSAREAIRPIIRKAKIPYFYSSLYEGGACDKYTFVTGVTASQEMKPLMKWAIKKYGKRIFIMGPDYNYGTISGHWVHKYAKDFGAKVVGEDYLPLSASNFSSTIQKIQRSKPDFVVALAVGANQTSFYEQFSAAGLKSKIGIVSTNYGSGNQQVVVSPQAGNGIIAAANYFDSLNTPTNKVFKAAWTKAYGHKEPIASGAVDVWLSVNLWAEAVQKAESAEPKKVVKALESGLTFEGPNGVVKMLPRSHHLQQNIYIAQGDMNHKFKIIKTFKSVIPSFEEKVCNLIKYPQTAKLFVPKL